MKDDIKKYRLYVVVLLYVCGLALGQFISLKIIWIVSAVLIFCSVILRYFRWRNFFLWSVMFFIGLGVLRMGFFNVIEFSHEFDSFVGTKQKFFLTITDLPHRLGKKVTMTAQSKEGSAVAITSNTYDDFFYGDKIEITGSIKKIPRGSFFAHKIFFKLSSNDVKHVDTSASVSKINIVADLYQIRLFFLKTIYSIFPSPEGELLAGLTVEGANAISDAQKEEFRRTGLSHIVALSGTNVVIVLEAAGILLKKTRREIRLVCMVLLICGFASMTGMGSTVVRASLMAIISVAADISRRTYNPLRALFIASFAMSLWNPYTPLVDISFQLSFMATLSMMLVSPVIERLLLRFIRYETIRETLCATLAAEVFVTPLILYYSGMFSLIAPLANVLVVPWIPFAMFFGFIPFLFSFIPIVAKIISLPGRMLLGYIFFATHFFSNLSFAAKEVHLSLPFLCITYAIIFLLLWYGHKKFGMKPQF